jgi:HAD superfamily hydrolase (TIGR01509 family)
MDGVLIDSNEVWKEIDIKFLGSRGFDLSDDFFSVTKAMSLPQVAEYTIKRFGLSDSVDELIQEWKSMLLHAYTNTIEMKAGAWDYLHSLRKSGAKIALATGSPPELYQPVLRRLGLYDFFDVFCCSDEVGCGKNQPDIWLLSAKRLGVEPKDCVVFEDVLLAIQSAKSVGMTTYGVYDAASDADWEQVKQTADYTIRKWEELL